MLLLLLPALSGALVSAGEADKTFAAVVGLVQATVPGDGTDVAANHRLVTDSLAAETRTLVQGMDGASLDLVLWPENATAVDPADDPIAAGALEAAVDMADAPLLAGAVVDGPTAGTALNQSLLWTATGEVVGRYTKQRLVPFGEYVPLRPLAERLSNRVQAIRRDMVPGPAPSPLPVGPMRLATALCFDIAYDDVVRDQVAEGANLVAVQTSNAMFLGTAQPEQQWQVSRARALEVGRAIVVSSVNGVSGAVMPDGRVLTRLPERIAGSDVVRVPLSHELTWATRVGAWPIRTVWFVGLMALLVAVVSRLRTDHPATAVSPSPDSPVLP
jgi:apolipoprotein N-acyltransferase